MSTQCLVANILKEKENKKGGWLLFFPHRLEFYSWKAAAWKGNLHSVLLASGVLATFRNRGCWAATAASAGSQAICNMLSSVFFFFAVQRGGHAQFPCVTPPRHTQEIKGCLQFRYKPFFTPPSTHRKPITSNAALATNLIMEAFHHLMCVQLHLRVCICHFVLSPAVIIFGKHGWNCYCSPAKKCLIPYPWMFVCSHKMCKDSSGLCVCVCVYFPGDLHGL